MDLLHVLLHLGLVRTGQAAVRAVSLGHRTRAATKHNVLPQSTTSDFARRA